MNQPKVTTRTLSKMKQNKERIAMITAYDFPTARRVEEAGIDVVLVGDSLGMVVLGYASTVFVTLEDMLHHTKAVTRAARHAMVIADIPFGVAHLSKDAVVRAAMTLMQEGGAYGVKIEGGIEVKDTLHTLTNAGIPVMGHLGLTPQSVNQLGGYSVQGKDKDAAQKLLESAKELERIGVFSLVLECVPEEVAKIVTESVRIPVIGIGAGRYCDGQVLVFHDAVGIGGDAYPSFVKAYDSLGDAMVRSVREYVSEVKMGMFPTSGHVSHVSCEMARMLKEEENVR